MKYCHNTEIFVKNVKRQKYTHAMYRLKCWLQRKILYSEFQMITKTRDPGYSTEKRNYITEI